MPTLFQSIEEFVGASGVGILCLLGLFLIVTVRLTPPLPGMPAIVSRTVPDDFRSFYQRDFRLFTAKNKTFGHLSDRTKKIEIDRVLTLEHYTCNKVFVSPSSLLANATYASFHLQF
jgi:hypothetical protein